jgi:hypothetical protein
MMWLGLMGNGTVTGPFIFRHNINGEDYLQQINGNCCGRQNGQF